MCFLSHPEFVNFTLPVFNNWRITIMTLTQRNALLPTTPEIAIANLTARASETIASSQTTAYWMAGDLNIIKIRGEQTNGAFTLFDTFVVPQGGPPPHIHLAEDEWFYVLEGEITFRAGDQWILATPGTPIFVPKGTIHNFKNTGTSIAHMITLFTPAGIEGLFAEVGTLATTGDLVAPPVTQEFVDRISEAAPKYNLVLA
jgi:quercetin dioxygenase-like cupin family protein